MATHDPLAAEGPARRTPGEVLIEVDHLYAGYDGTAILDDVSFNIRAGEVFGILGGSGGGKSTILKHMIGLVPPVSGHIRFAGEDIVGEVVTVTVADYEHTINTYAEAYGVGFRQLVAANPGVNPWVPGEGRKVLMPGEFILPPGPRVGVVLNLAEQRLYYYQPDGKTVVTYPVGIGREDWQTPQVSTTVTKVVKDPSWTPPASIRREHAAMGDPLPAVVPPGPDNPLGPWAIRLAAPGYLIHGSNKELGVGMRVSHGCMRLYNEDVEEFARLVTPGTLAVSYTHLTLPTSDLV